MTEIRMEKDGIVRIIAQVMRDDYKLTPEKANEAAENIGRRLVTSLPTPTTPSLSGSRLIRRYCPIDFIEAFKKMLREDRGALAHHGSLRMTSLTNFRPSSRTITDMGSLAFDFQKRQKNDRIQDR